MTHHPIATGFAVVSTWIAGAGSASVSHPPDFLSSLVLPQTSELSSDEPASAIPPVDSQEALICRMATERLARSPHFAALPDSEKAKVDLLWGLVDSVGKSDLALLIDQTRPSSEISALYDIDNEGQTLIDNLCAVAEGLSAEFKNYRSEIIGDLLADVAFRELIVQGRHRTCAASSVQYMICVENPAEYVRLMRGLLGHNKAAFPRHGAPLVLVEDSVPDDESSFLGRTMTERVFQSAIMDLGNGRLEYSSRDDVSRAPAPLGKEKPKGSSGLYRDECRFVMECIYGEPVTVIDRFPVAREILKNRPAGLTFVGIISGGEGHAIAVVNADEKGIRYRDPNYPGTLFMPWSEFRSRFRFLFLPGSVVDQLKDLPGEVA